MARHAITGLCIREASVEWTTLARSNKGFDVVATRQVPLEAGGGDAGDPAARAAAIRRICPDLAGPVVVGLEPGRMLMRVVQLPTTDPAEIAGMVQLQMDRASPFPEDRMAVSHEVLHLAGAGCRVLIVAVLKDHVEALGDLCKRLGLVLRRIDADALGWWHLLAAHGAVPAAGRHLLLLLEPAGGVWIAVQDGVPLAFKAAAAAGGLPPAEYAEELAGDLGSLIVSLDLDYGVQPVTGLDLWCREVDPADIRARLQTELGHEVRLESLDALPPLSEGLARRMFVPPFSERAPARQAVLDLVPTVWRAATGAARSRRRLLAAATAALGLWAIVLGVFIAGFQVNRRALARREAQMERLRQPADNVRALQRQVRAFEAFLDRQRSALECLREASLRLPTDVNLTTFQFKKGRTVTLRGEARQVDAIYDFKKALDQVALFEGVEMGNIQPGRRKDITVQTFQMTARLKEDAP